MRHLTVLICVALILCSNIFAQDYITTADQEIYLIESLNLPDETGSNAIRLIKNDERDEAKKIIADYFSEKLAQRYFFSWKVFDEKFNKYKSLYPSHIENHKRRAQEMMELYPSDNGWNLPMLSNDGNELTAYEFRHLARQHKAVDIMFTYFNENENVEYLHYIRQFLNSLKASYLAKTFEVGGNGVIESFRAGYRVFNWLQVFNAFCASANFNTDDKFLFLETFYYHALELQKETEKFRYGNHHTKGLMALALISILFPEFNGSKQWLEQSFNLLTEHLEKEVNEDGFQIERSVHYHIGDIDNYFYVYYLAKHNGIEVPTKFENKIYTLFEALTKVAYQNNTLPVLQDDTDSPWAEYNNLTSTMALGSILFDDDKFRYFASKEIPADIFWFLSESDLIKLKGEKKTPEFLSVSLPETGYYVFRNGWKSEDISLIISAGLSKYKPDHQHGDMLGMQLYAYENYMLPNYQVRYFLEDYPYFKNSFTKNVCLVDSIPHGNNWKPNSGGSGFGIFESLPDPSVEVFYTSSKLDVFQGSIKYAEANISRKVFFIKDGIIIVKDEFNSNTQKSFQQIWQGIYSKENDKHFRSVFSNGSGLDIIQLNSFDKAATSEIRRGKGSIIFNKNIAMNSSYTTLLVPFEQFETRIDEKLVLTDVSFKGWNYSKNSFRQNGLNLEADHILQKDEYIILIGLKKINDLKIDNNNIDLFYNISKSTVILLNNYSAILSNGSVEYKLIPFLENSIIGKRNE